MSSQQFGAWLRRQRHRNDLIGDLATDYATRCPESCPACQGARPRTVDGIMDHLRAHNACAEAIEACTAAIAEWGAA